MAVSPEHTTVESLHDVLDAMVDVTNQLFFHTHMLRAWGHSEAEARNLEWIEKMRRHLSLTLVLCENDARPRSRAARDLELGTDTRSVFESDAALTRWFIARVERARTQCTSKRVCAALDDVLEAAGNIF